MEATKQNNWKVIKPLVLMGVILIVIILSIHSVTAKPHKAIETSTGSCKKINADVLNAITVKLM